jgi:RNA polymerase sigma factor (sigma-70 family)
MSATDEQGRSTVRKGGDAAMKERPAFETFDDYFRTDYRSVVGFLMLLGAGFEEARDAAQEGMVEAARRWGSIDHPKAYVRIAARRAYYRQDLDDRRSRLATVGRRTDSESDLAVNTAALNDWVTTITELDAIQSSCNALPEAQREVVAMHIQGFTPQEIAAELGRNSATVRSNLRHGLSTLRRSLMKTANPEPTGRHS